MPDGDLTRAVWSWPDERLHRLRELGIRPVVGLLHHGNGPPTTDLLDPRFPRLFADYARAVAERYPWIDAYVPINEPLTTARFCGLYGLWYPHGRDVATFARILYHQIRATVLAVREIRDVNPGAAFIQNEDLGYVHSTPLLAYEAKRQNERRWLTFDLLCGRFERAHAMWSTLTQGVDEDELLALRDDPVPPDLLGIDHYVTSERYLDESVDGYPERYLAANATHVYADVEAVWSFDEGPLGIERLMAEAWARYGMPMAITEAHLGGSREEQIRWLTEMWDAAASLRASEVDVRGVTAWSLFGAYDWNTLLTEAHGFYESGAFDVRGPEPRPTALAETIRCLASGRRQVHPVLTHPGWWRRPERLIYGRRRAEAAARAAPRRRPAQPLAVVTDGGLLGGVLREACMARGLPLEEIDVAATTDPSTVEEAITAVAPWGVVDLIGFAQRFDAAYEEEVLRERLSSTVVREVVAARAAIASAASAARIPAVAVSSWLVFDGRVERPRLESDSPDAATPLGLAWRRAERGIRAAWPRALIARAGPLLGSPVAPDVPLRDARDDGAMVGGVVAFTSPVDLLHVALDLLLDREKGIWHLTNVGLAPVSSTPVPVTTAVLGTERGSLLPSLDDAVARFRETCAGEIAGRGAASGAGVAVDEVGA